MIKVKCNVTSRHFVIEMYNEIDRISSFEEMLDALHEAGDNDVVELKINSGGGCCSAGMMIVKAIKDCRAHVMAHIVYPSYSIAAVIAMACNSLIIDEHCYLMFHSHSQDTGGKFGGLRDYFMKSNKQLIDMTSEICSPFLTKKELKDMYNDKDIYIHHDDPTLPQRIKRHYGIEIQNGVMVAV